MLKDLLARFKKVFTVAEWKKEAQDAIAQKEFVIASLAELHRVEKADAANSQERTRQQQMGRTPMGAVQPQPVHAANYRTSSPTVTRTSAMNREQDNRKKNEFSLAELMNQIKQQQQQL